MASIEATGRRMKAGTNCGVCKPEICKLLNGAAAPKPQPA
ncbi:(2Fe-2S)-binding protein [Ensifer sp. YR511]|nr:(2Fe-2S)-binding protein [Ensifer sp. YR511]